MPGIVSYFVTAVNGALAANLGVLLGLSISHGVRRSPPNASDLFPWLAAVWYVAMLLLATAFWGMADFTDDGSKVVSLLPEMTKNAIGIFVAILAAVLGVHTREKAILERDDGHGSAKPSGGPDSAG